MASDRNRIRELAIAARDAWVGTWPRHESQPATCRDHGKFVCAICFSNEAAERCAAADYKFTAAISPDVVTELLDAADSADERVRTARVAGLREALDVLCIARPAERQVIEKYIAELTNTNEATDE